MSDSLDSINESENEEQEKKEPVIEPLIALNTKPIPIIITLCGATIAGVTSVIQFVDFNIFFFRLLKAVIVFGLIGIVVKICLDFIFNRRVKKIKEELLKEKELEKQRKAEEEKAKQEELEESEGLDSNQEGLDELDDGE